MIKLELIWLIICGSGVMQSLFLGVFLLFAKGEREVNKWLGLLMLAISLRLLKSMGWYFWGIESQLFLNLGFAAHAFIGPLLFIYVQKKLSVGHFSNHYLWAILAPGILVLLAVPWVSLENFWYIGGYHALLYETILFLIWSGYYLLRGKSNKHFNWVRNLYFLVVIFGLAYFTNYILGINSYITGPIAYSLLIYVISYMIFSQTDLISSKARYRNLSLSAHQMQRYQETIESVMQTEKPYLNRDFNQTQLSQLTGIPKHTLSKVLSEQIGIKFADYVNGYRIEFARDALGNESKKHLKIAGIAFESGFNSLSSFNAAFKKNVGITPSRFREKSGVYSNPNQ